MSWETRFKIFTVVVLPGRPPAGSVSRDHVYHEYPQEYDMGVARANVQQAHKIRRKGNEPRGSCALLP